MTESDFQAQDSSAAAGMETRAQIAGGHPIIRHNNTDQCQTSANIVRRVVPAPVKRIPAENDAATTVPTTVPTRVSHPVIRRAPAPVRIATGEPLTAATQTPLAKATVDSIERFGAMVEAACFGLKPEQLVLFGAGLYDQNGKPRASETALKVTTKSKKARVRRAAPKRNDGFKTKGGLTALANLLPSQESAADCV